MSEPKKVQLDVQYRSGHSYHERWVKTDHHCPSCGVLTVWREQSEGDYYVGPILLCGSCGAEWTMQGPSLSPEPGYLTEQRLNAIRGAPTMTTTEADGASEEARELVMHHWMEVWNRSEKVLDGDLEALQDDLPAQRALLAHIASLEAQVERMREALEYYANDSRWGTMSGTSVKTPGIRYAERALREPQGE